MPRALQADGGSFNSLAFSLDGRVLASASTVDGCVRFWSLKDGTEVRTRSLAFSPDGRSLVSALDKAWQASIVHGVAMIAGVPS